MKIGIIGSNDRAVAIGRLLASEKNEVSFSDPAHPDTAEEAARRAGVATEIPYRQAMTKDVLIVAAPREELDRDLNAMGPHPSAIVVDAAEGSTATKTSGAELLSHMLDDHRVVRALVVLPQEGANVPICGDDANAKVIVDRMFQEAGCITTDRGPLSAAKELEPRPVAA